MIPALGAAQVTNTVYVNTFSGSTVGEKTSNAQRACSTMANLPCIVVFDLSLAAYAVGTMPSPCAQCIWQDYRPAVPGTFATLSVNGAVNAAFFSGPDIGAQVNGAIASLPNGCGEVIIPTGSYTQKTTIIKPRCTRLHGASSFGTTLTWQPSGGTAIVSEDSAGVYDYS